MPTGKCAEKAPNPVFSLDEIGSLVVQWKHAIFIKFVFGTFKA